MKQIDSPQHILYTQAIKDPSILSEDDLLQLIVRYPYSQPLIFAYERRKRLLGEDSLNKSLALLYAPSASWLYNFLVTKPNEAVLTSDGSVEQEVLVQSISDQVDVVKEEESICAASFEMGEEIETVVDSEETTISKSESDELDRLVNQGSALVNYFVFEEKTGVEEKKALVTGEDVENVSLYNDDLMPYSFRWWLQKTRLEHANTYQPFVTPTLTQPNSPIVDFGKLDEAILDQQIKEHIIHFQDPESKLSDQVKKLPLEQVQPKKSDKIIERFIREEPIIQAPSPANLNNENMARQSAEDNFVLVTETLAVIYKDQGLYQKAIDVFDKLILKYPEKKSYFATQIKELEKNL